MSADKSVGISLPGPSRRKFGQFEVKVWSPEGDRIEVKSTKNLDSETFAASLERAMGVMRPIANHAAGRKNAFVGLLDKNGEVRP